MASFCPVCGTGTKLGTPSSPGRTTTSQLYNQQFPTGPSPAPARETARQGEYEGLGDAAIINKSTTTNPLTGLNGIIVFVLLVIAGVGVALAGCSTALGLPVPTELIVIELFTILVALGWIVFTISDNSDMFFRVGAIVAALSGPVIAMVLTLAPILFWLSLVILLVLAVTISLEETESTKIWERIFISIYVAWVVAGITVTLGSTRYLPYATPATAISEVHFLLDARYLLTSLLLLSAVGNAMFKAFEAGWPSISPPPSIGLLNIPDTSDSPNTTLFRPFLVVTNVILLIVDKLTSLLWQLSALVLAYLYRTGVNLADHFYSLITNRIIWRAIGRVLLTFLTTLVFTEAVTLAAPEFHLYLTKVTSLSSISLSIAIAMVWMGVFALLTLCCVLFICWLWKPGGRFIDPASFGGTMILVALSLSGGVMYVVAKTRILNIIGFDSLGLLTLLILILIGSVFLYQMAQRVTGVTAKK